MDKSIAGLPSLVEANEQSITLAPGEVTPEAKTQPKWDLGKNHGRYGAEDYRGCPAVFIAHASLNPGDFCQDCLTFESQGKLYECTPRVVVQLKGTPLITGVRYELSRLRCTLCGKYYTASLPKEAQHRKKYDETCRSMVAISRYYAGFPFYRTQQLQALHGIPLADSTQWDLIRQLYRGVLPVYCVLEQCAAQGDLFYYDDTGNRIIELQKEEKAAHTTAFISMWEKHAICLFYTSQAMGEKNLELLLKNRITDNAFFTMADASSHNIPKSMDENLVARWILCFCLVHGRRKFYELQHLYSKECELVLDIISQVYGYESYCKKNQLDHPARLRYHQQHSAPLMASLKTWLNNQLLHRYHEPNSAFGQAVAYMLRHWKPLTRFLEEAGAPLDNSLCEQMIKIAIRHRRNSLFYKTVCGKEIRDR